MASRPVGAARARSDAEGDGDAARASRSGAGDWVWLAFTCALLAVTLAPFFLVSTPTWDGWPHYAFFMRGDQAAMLQHMTDNGRPLAGWAMWLSMDVFGAVHGPKLVMCISLLLGAVCAFAALRASRLASAPQAAAAAVVAGTVPAMQTLLSGCMVQYFVGFALFFAGLWCFVSAERARGAGRVVLELAAAVCAISAALIGEAPLAITPLYPLLRVAARCGTLEPRRILRAWPAIAGLSWIVFLAAAALALQFHLFPAQGAHAGAHDFEGNPVLLLRNVALYVVTLVLCSGPVLLALAWFARGRWREVLPTLATGLAVLALGVLPYWAAGRLPSPMGWGIRMLLFTGPGLALLVLGVLRALPAHAQARSAITLAVIAALALLARLPPWAGREATDAAVAAAARASETLPVGALVVVHDPGWTVAGPYRNYEWTAMLQLATGRQDILALNAGEERDFARWRDYFRKDLALVRGTHVDTRCPIDMLLPRRSVLDAVRGTALTVRFQPRCGLDGSTAG